MPDSSSANLQPLLTTYGIIVGVVSLVSVLISIIIWWRILSKAGYSGAFSILCVLFPPAALVFVLILAFAEWPVQRELKMLRSQVQMQPPQFGSGPQYPANPQYPQYR
ncbi:MAG TPA: hypothetical protein VKX46_19090 [Ktedonobacteraceae bacterium]|nr:hypothetical protein [Ktedonobacteraceae bacterium]